jgi:hypothetical protein
MRQFLAALGVMSAVAFGSTAQAATITFDDPGLLAGTEVGDFYADLGVTFVDATIAVTSGTHYYYGVGDREPSSVLVHSTTGSQPQPDDPIEVLFDSAVSFVSLEGLGIGISGYMLSAYDVLGNLLATTERMGSGQPGGEGAFNLFTLSLSASGIRRLAISQMVSTYDTAVFDNLTFTPEPVGTPEPGTLSLLSGAFGLLLIRRRRSSGGRKV